MSTPCTAPRRPADSRQGCLRGQRAWRWRPAALTCPRPALQTLPMMHSCTAPGARPARARAAWMASAPSCVAGSAASAPWKPPKGVRAALTMHTSAQTRACLLTTAAPRVPGYQAAARRECRTTWRFGRQSAAVAECRSDALIKCASHVVTLARQVSSIFTAKELQQE